MGSGKRELRKLHITVITGSMGSGKSEHILEVIKDVESYYENPEKQILVCTSLSCCRELGYLTSRNGEKHKAHLVSSFKEILNMLQDSKDCKVLFVDEVQLLESPTEDMIELINYCTDRDIMMYFSGLDISCIGEPFPIIAYLLCYADEIIKLKGTCAICGKENSSNRAIRYADDKIDLDRAVVKADTNQIQIETSEGYVEKIKGITKIEYKSVCAECYLKEMRKYHEDALRLAV